MLHREWIECDFYADLGVARDASAEEISDAYRALARDLHPDRNPGDSASEARFKAISRAYAVLGSPTRRAQYDEARDKVFDRGVAPMPGSTRPTTLSVRPRRSLSLRPSVGFTLAAVCVVAGVAVGVWILNVSRTASELRRRGVSAVGVVTTETPVATLQFTTDDGTVVTANAPRARDRRNGGYRVGEAVPIRYDRLDPTRLVADEAQPARIITMWIIAAKLVICGLILAAMAGYRLRRTSPLSAQPDGVSRPLLNVTKGT